MAKQPRSAGETQTNVSGRQTNGRTAARSLSLTQSSTRWQTATQAPAGDSNQIRLGGNRHSFPFRLAHVKEIRKVYLNNSSNTFNNLISWVTFHFKSNLLGNSAQIKD